MPRWPLRNCAGVGNQQHTGYFHNRLISNCHKLDTSAAGLRGTLSPKLNGCCRTLCGRVWKLVFSPMTSSVSVHETPFVYTWTAVRSVDLDTKYSVLWSTCSLFHSRRYLLIPRGSHCLSSKVGFFFSFTHHSTRLIVRSSCRVLALSINLTRILPTWQV